MKKLNKKCLYLSAIAAALVLTGCNNVSDILLPLEGVDQSESSNVSILFTKGSGFTYNFLNGLIVDSDNVATIIKNTNISFSVSLENGYYEGYDYAVLAGDTPLTPNEDGVYTYQVTDNTNIFVNDVVDYIPTYRIATSLSDGVILKSDYTPQRDGSLIVNQGEFSFSLDFEKSFLKTDAFKVMMGNDTLTADDEGNYSYIVKDINTLKVIGTEFVSHIVTLKNTNLYVFDEVTGVDLIDGVGEIGHDREVTFKFKPSGIAEIDKGGVVIKNNGQTLTPINGIYTINVTEDTNIEVSGIKAAGEILADCSVLAVGSVTISKDVDHINTNSGFTKSSKVIGSWAAKPQLVLNSNDVFEKYNMLKFSIFCENDAYFEFFTSGKGEYDALVNSAKFNDIYIAKEDDGTGGHIYRLYRYSYDDSGKTNATMLESQTINELLMRVNGTYYVSELLGILNPDYVDPHHTLDVAPLVGATPSGDVFTFKSSYNVANHFANVNPMQYESMEVTFSFGEIAAGKGWCGLGTVGNAKVEDKLEPNTNYVIAIKKLGNGIFNVTFNGKNKGDLELDTDLSNLVFYAHDNSAGKISFTISKFAVIDDKQYDPQVPITKEVTVSKAATATHVTYVIDGQSSPVFSVNKGSNVVLTLAAESGYIGHVSLNGEPVSGNNNVYTMKIDRISTISISETKQVSAEVILEKPFANLGDKKSVDYFKSVDPSITTGYENTSLSGTYYGLGSVDISDLEYLYCYFYNINGTKVGFSNTNSDSGWMGRPDKALFKVEIIKDSSSGLWTVYIDGAASGKKKDFSADDLANIFYICCWGKTCCTDIYGY